MKLTLGREELLEGLQISQRAISTRSMLPILSGILLRTEQGKVTLSATDLEISIRTAVKAKVGEKGSLVVPARLIMDILSNMEEPKVDLVMGKEKGQLEISAGKSRFSVNILFEEDFPKVPSAPPEPACKIGREALVKVVTEVVKAASRDEGKPIMSGVLTDITRTTLRMVATDSYRLAICEQAIDGGPEKELSILIPARSLRELSRILSASDEKEITVSPTDNQAMFGVGEVQLMSRLIEGEFPNYKQLIPESYEHKIRMNKEQLIGATRRMALLAQDSAPVKLSFADKALTMSASTQDVGEASEALEADYTGEELKIAFNPHYLLDGLTSVDETELLLEMTDPLKPALIRPAKGKGFLYLIMPVRIV